MTFNYELVALWLHKETEYMPVTIYDIARAAGVSPSTVSRALSGST